MARQVHDAVIASGQSQSTVIDCGSEYTLVAIEIPTTWTAADITLLGAVHTGRTPATTFGQSPQDVLETQLTFRPVYGGSGSEFTITVGATGDKILTIADGLLEGLQFIKVRSGTAAAPVNQGGDRTLRCVVAE